MKMATAERKRASSATWSVVPSRVATIRSEQPLSLNDDMRGAMSRCVSQPLPDRVRSPLESVFGHDFSGIRVHADRTADTLCRDHDSQALTVGSNIFLRTDLYQPDAPEGFDLLSHELVHAMQRGDSTAVHRQKAGSKIVAPLAGARQDSTSDEELANVAAGASATAYVTNNSATTIYFKPEDAGTALPVAPKTTSDEPIDGVATHKYKDKVYKAVTGAKVTVDEDGDVDADFSIGQAVVGGWKDKKWLAERHAVKPTPDHGWDALFAKAATIVSPPPKPNIFQDIWQKTIRGLYNLESWGG